MNYLRKYMVAALMAMSAATAMPASPAWETVSAASLQPEQADGDAIDVNVQDRHIYITVRRPQQVSVLSILGQMISQTTLQPGTYRLRIASRGIYILQIGTTTRRVTV